MFGKTIFKRDATGELRQWRFEVDGAQWRSHAGKVGGEQVVSGWTICVPRSKPTADEQALFEAEAEMGKKLAKDYALTVETVDEPRAAGGKPMLAHKFEGWKDWAPGFVFSQPKLDGMRCKVNRHDMWSRTGKPIVSCPHIFAHLGPAFANNPDLELDGELYAHELKADFPELMSILRKSKPSEEDVAKAASTVKYHVYDLAREDRTFGERARMLELFVQALDTADIVFVPTTPIADLGQLDQAYATYLEEGYEGQMVRLNGPYERKRSNLLLKRKEFETREFELVTIEAGNGNWAGLAKRVTFKMPDGRIGGAGIKGNREQAAKLLAEAPDLIGKPVTIRYFPEPDNKNLPRFGVAIDFNRPDL